MGLWILQQLARRSDSREAPEPESQRRPPVVRR